MTDIRQKTADADIFTVSPVLWEDLTNADPSMVCQRSGALRDSRGNYIIRVINRDIRIDPAGRLLHIESENIWGPNRDSLRELVLLNYLTGAGDQGVIGRMIGTRDLKDAHFFQGPHQLRTSRIVGQYGHDPEGFSAAGKRLGAKPIDHGDAAFTLTALPKIPIHFLLWAGDEEFPPHLTVLFDGSIESHLEADGIWGLVTLASRALVSA